MGVGERLLAAITSLPLNAQNEKPMRVNKPIALIIAIGLLTLVPTIIGTLRGGGAKADRPLPRMLPIPRPHVTGLVLIPESPR